MLNDRYKNYYNIRNDNNSAVLLHPEKNCTKNKKTLNNQFRIYSANKIFKEHRCVNYE